jgi:hypothetical protein
MRACSHNCGHEWVRYLQEILEGYGKNGKMMKIFCKCSGFYVAVIFLCTLEFCFRVGEL